MTRKRSDPANLTPGRGFPPPGSPKAPGQATSESPRLPAITFRVLLSHLQAGGLSERALLEGTAVSPAALARRGATVSADDLTALIRNGLRGTGLPHLGLLLGRRFRLRDFGLFGYALMSCATLGDAARLGARVWPMVGAELTITPGETDEEAHWTLAPSFPLGDLWSFTCERWISGVVAGARTTTGRALVPYRIELGYPPPDHAERYEEVLRLPVRFDAPCTRVSLARRLLATPNLYPDDEVAALCARRCDALAARHAGEDPLVTSLRRVLVESAGRYPDLDEAAARLGKSGRSLRRHLRAAGVTFQAVLDSTRADLATDYLVETSFTTQEIGWLVGFGEPTNFRKAYLRWTGVPARRVRGQSRGGPAAGSGGRGR